MPASLQSFQNSPPLSVIAYCLSSISMTVTNKYCVSGANWNLNFFYLAVQVCLCWALGDGGMVADCGLS